MLSLSRLWRCFLVVSALLVGTIPAKALDTFDPTRLNEGGYVVMMRHARAPGTGDPQEVVIGDCTTQRNLSDGGREQSRRLGALFKNAGVTGARVFSSEWCRCVDTATLMDLGPVETFHGLSSFFSNNNRGRNLKALGEKFQSLPIDGAPVVMVTHQVNITAVTDKWIDEGDSYVLKLNGTATPDLVGVIRSPGYD